MAFGSAIDEIADQNGRAVAMTPHALRVAIAHVLEQRDQFINTAVNIANDVVVHP